MLNLKIVQTTGIVIAAIAIVVMNAAVVAALAAARK